MDQHKNARNILAYAAAQDSMFAHKDIQHLSILCRGNPWGGGRTPEPAQSGRKIALEIVEPYHFLIGPAPDDGLLFLREV